MAWANGNKRWTLPFVSLNGTSCRVDIYQRGYTGSTVTTLTGADNPFEYEEDDDSDLLNGVIRYRTGYLRVIEETQGEHHDLYPLLNNAHYIEFYYGSALDFNGFIQAQEFENDWAPGPRVIELPVMSPLGLANGTKIDYTDWNPPRWVSFQSLLSNIFGKLDVPYGSYYFPKILSKQPYSGNILEDLYVNSLTFCPFGSSYDKTNRLEGIYEPKTVGDALTMICTAFGCILHDHPDQMVFQRVDYMGDYIRIFLTSGRSVVSQGTTDITNIATVSSADNTESVVMPMSKIEVTYQGDEDVPDMSFERCRGYSRGCGVADREFCTNLPMISDLQGTFEYAESINSNGNLATAGKVCLGAYGGDSLAEMIMYRTNNWAARTLIAKYTFFEWFNRHQRLCFKFRFGYGLEELNNEQFAPVIGVVIRRGDYMWYASSNSWVNSPASSTTGYSRTFNGNGRQDFELAFSTGGNGTPQPLTVEFYVVSDHSNELIHVISDVRLEMFESASYVYLEKNLEPKTFTIDGNPSDIEGSVERGYGLLAPTQNRISDDPSKITGTDWVTLINSEPTYPYLLQAQDRLQIGMKMTYQTAETLYLNKMTVWGSTGKWRVIARAFRPWNDEHVMTFHHSPVFDN
jgi:hypothetical protein